jgi:hypothetical protein
MAMKIVKDEQRGRYSFHVLLSWQINSAQLDGSFEKRKSITKSQGGNEHPTHIKVMD